MNEQLAKRYEKEILETLGHSGRMISMSKSGYTRLFPDRPAIFNANVCLSGGKVWHGDLDLQHDEPRLIELARRIGQTLYVLSEPDARFENEDRPQLDQAVFSVTSSGHYRFDTRRVERSLDGRLRTRRLEQWERRRLVFPIAAGRWPFRLWRFWEIEKKTDRYEFGEEGCERVFRLRIGGKGMDPDATWRRRLPALVFGVIRRTGERRGFFRCELTWYPGGRWKSAPRPLLNVSPELKLPFFRPYLGLRVHQGRQYSLVAGVSIGRRRSW